MSKAEPAPSFHVWLARKIEDLYHSDSDFAREAGISASAVSRLVAGKGKPAPSTLEKIAPALQVSPGLLYQIAYEYDQPELPFPVNRQPARHPLANDLDRMLDEEGPVPAGERERIATLVEALLDPYRRHLPSRRRRAS